MKIRLLVMSCLMALSAGLSAQTSNSLCDKTVTLTGFKLWNGSVYKDKNFTIKINSFNSTETAAPIDTTDETANLVTDNVLIRAISMGIKYKKENPLGDISTFYTGTVLTNRFYKTSIKGGKPNIVALVNAVNTVSDDVIACEKSKKEKKLEIVAVSKITFNEKEVSMTVGDVKDISYTVEPSDATDPAVTVVSSAPNVATADLQSAVSVGITAIAPGSATITITSKDGSNKSDTISVTVKKATPTFNAGWEDKWALAAGNHIKTPNTGTIEKIEDLLDDLEIDGDKYLASAKEQIEKKEHELKNPTKTLSESKDLEKEIKELRANEKKIIDRYKYVAGAFDHPCFNAKITALGTVAPKAKSQQLKEAKSDEKFLDELKTLKAEETVKILDEAVYFNINGDGSDGKVNTYQEVCVLYWVLTAFKKEGKDIKDEVKVEKVVAKVLDKFGYDKETYKNLPTLFKGGLRENDYTSETGDVLFDLLNILKNVSTDDIDKKIIMNEIAKIEPDYEKGKGDILAPKPTPETKPEAKPETKPEAKPETKPEAKPETKPEAKPETKPAGANSSKAPLNTDPTTINTTPGVAPTADELQKAGTACVEEINKVLKDGGSIQDSAKKAFAKIQKELEGKNVTNTDPIKRSIIEKLVQNFKNEGFSENSQELKEILAIIDYIFGEERDNIFVASEDKNGNTMLEVDGNFLDGLIPEIDRVITDQKMRDKLYTKDAEGRAIPTALFNSIFVAKLVVEGLPLLVAQAPRPAPAAGEVRTSSGSARTVNASGQPATSQPFSKKADEEATKEDLSKHLIKKAAPADARRPNANEGAVGTNPTGR